MNRRSGRINKKQILERSFVEIQNNLIREVVSGGCVIFCSSDVKNVAEQLRALADELDPGSGDKDLAFRYLNTVKDAIGYNKIKKK